MPKQEYDWELGAPAVLEPHSVAKHTILREYVEEYVQILTQNPRVPEFSLTIVDGFAGGGEYVTEDGARHDGSPFILMEAVREAQVQVSLRRKKPFILSANFIFVEKKRSNFIYLEDALARRLDKESRSRVTAILGAFEEQLDQIIGNIKSVRGREPRPIFVLDQYGHSAVPVPMIAKIMRELPRAEVFLTLAYDWIGAYARGPEAQALRVHKSLDIAPHLQGFALGSRPIDEIDDLPPNDKVAAMRYIQQLLHEGFAKYGGAKCYTPFFITSRKSHRSYWFLHLANSARANDVVKELHWKIKNHFVHYGGAGLLMLGYDPSRPPDDAAQRAFYFDKSAHDRTTEALLEDLPRRLQEKYAKSVSAGELYASICNETPAPKSILFQAIDRLCADGALAKKGAEGEQRAATTRTKDSDVIEIPAQRIFSFPRK